jgi:uncharacterized protein YdhG (YjbR/CyaY superfamily)
MAAVIEAHQAELAAYDTSKGTIRFPPGKPPPETLVRRLIEAQIDEIEAAAAARKRRSKARADD